jgi:hypothetical protein
MPQQPPAHGSHGSHAGAQGAQRTGAHGATEGAAFAATGRRAGVAVAGVRVDRTASGRAAVRSAARTTGVDCEALTCPGRTGCATPTGRAARVGDVRGIGATT